MPTTCDRHPTQPAWWHCPRCHKYLCPQCIARRTGGHFQEQTYYFCPKCNIEVNTQELSQVITPFWARLHKFFVYPVASVQSAVLILVLSLLSAFFSQPGLISLVIQFVLWSMMVKYSFESLKSTAEGRFLPPPLSGKVLGEDYDIVLKQIALYLSLFLIFIFFVVKTGLPGMVLFGIVCAIALPAMITILIINNDLGQALNPVMVVGLIFRIGWSYFLLLFFLLLLSSAPAALGYAIIRHLPESLQLFMITAAKNYYTLITYHMMGYVILQYHNRVGYPVELDTILASMYPAGLSASQNNESTPQKTRHDDLLNEIGLLVQEGDLDKAIEQIEQQVNIEEIDDLELSDRYVGLLTMRKQKQKLLDYAPRHLEMLVKAGSKSKSIKLYIDCLRMEKTFAPKALILFKIASWLSTSQKHKEAIFALNTLIKTYPEDTLVPKAYYRAAQIFNEQLKNADQARKILNGLLRKFPDHEISAFAKNYLSGI